MTPSSKRKGVSREAYKLLAGMGFTNENRVYNKKTEAKKIAELEATFNEAEIFVVQSWSPPNLCFKVSMCSYSSRGVTVVIPAFWRSSKKYINAQEVREYMKVLLPKKNDLEENGQFYKIQSYIDQGWLPKVSMQVIKALKDIGYDESNYYKSQDAYERSLKNSHPSENRIELTPLPGLTFYFINASSGKYPKAWTYSCTGVKDEELLKGIELYKNTL